MPTFGWMQEDATEAYLLATQSVSDPRGPLPQTYRCPICMHIAIAFKALQDHLEPLPLT